MQHLPRLAAGVFVAPPLHPRPADTTRAPLRHLSCGSLLVQCNTTMCTQWKAWFIGILLSRYTPPSRHTTFMGSKTVPDCRTELWSLLPLDVWMARARSGPLPTSSSQSGSQTPRQTQHTPANTITAAFLPPYLMKAPQ